MRPEISTNLDTRPYFCPACGHGPRGHEDRDRLLCDHCGEALKPQGYCPICERYLLREPGTLCPKHDVALDDDDGASRSLVGHGEDRPIDWVTVQEFPNSLAVEAARIRLEAEGLPTFVEGRRTGGPALNGVVTGVKLQVPVELAGQARILLDQRWAAPIDDEGWDGFGGDWDDDPNDEPPNAPAAESAVWFWIAVAAELLLWTSPLLIGLALYLWCGL